MLAEETLNPHFTSSSRRVCVETSAAETEKTARVKDAERRPHKETTPLQQRNVSSARLPSDLYLTDE